MYGIYWDGYYLPLKPCRPITYPDGEHITREISYTTQDSLKTVSQFFEQRLSPRLVEGLEIENGQWMKMEVDNELTLYWCESVDINRTTGETGCIYVRPEGDKTNIETEFIRFEGANWLCSEFYDSLKTSDP